MGLQRICDKCAQVIPIGAIYFAMSLEARIDSDDLARKTVVRIDASYCNVCVQSAEAFFELRSTYEDWENATHKADSGRIVT